MLALDRYIIEFKSQQWFNDFESDFPFIFYEQLFQTVIGF